MEVDEFVVVLVGEALVVKVLESEELLVVELADAVVEGVLVLLVIVVVEVDVGVLDSLVVMLLTVVVELVLDVEVDDVVCPVWITMTLPESTFATYTSPFEGSYAMC